MNKHTFHQIVYQNKTTKCTWL